jgi:ABC-type transport system substrate-binding protein
MNKGEYYAGTTYTFYADGSVRQENAAQGFDEVYGGSGAGDINASYTEGPYADEVIYSVYSDQNSQVLALKDGEIDFILSSLGLQSGLREQITTAPELSLIANASNGFRYLAYNMRKSPMSYLGFRKALACMIDKEFMAGSVLGGAAIPAYSLVPSGNVAWANPEVEEFCKGLSQEERVNTAIQLLKDDGFTWSTEPMWNADNLDVIPQGEGLTDPAGNTVPAMELLAPGPGYDPLRSTYSIWIAQWANDLGIPLTANPTGFSVIVDEVFAEGDLALEWDMYILGWGLGDPAFPDFHEAFFASYNDSADGGFNTPGYANDDVDQLAADLLAATDVEAAKDIVKAMDRIIVEEAPYVVLFTTPILEAYRNNVTFPFSDTLDGLQNLGGVPASVVVSD